METIYAQRGGGTNLFWRVTWPFAKLTITKQKVVCSIWPFKYTIPLKNVTSIETVNHFTVNRIKINHTVSGVPTIEFSPVNKTDLIEAFKKVGIKEEMKKKGIK